MMEQKKSDKYKDIIYVSTLWSDEIIELCKSHVITHFRQVEEWICLLSSHGIEQVAPHLFSSSLKYLDLNNNSIGDKGAFTIAQALKDSPSLAYLDIRRNGLTGKGVAAISDAIIKNNVTNFSLKVTIGDNEGVQALAELIKQCGGLASLEIHGVAQMGPIFHALKANVTLKELIIYDYRISGLEQQNVDDYFEENITFTTGCGPWTVEHHLMVNQICEELKVGLPSRRSIPKQLTQRKDIETFLQEVIRDSLPMNSMKLAFLGNGEVGKTTLLNAFREVQGKVVNDKKWFYTRVTDFLFFMFPARTIGIDQSILVIRGGELLAWDFGGQQEYAVTHQFFLSNEMVIYVICYDLSQPPEVQTQQLSYWLKFLNSTLALSSKSKWKVIIVGTKLDKQHAHVCDPLHTGDYAKLPVHSKPFSVASFNLTGVSDLLAEVEDICNSIFQQHSRLIPKSFKSLLDFLQTIPESQFVVPISQIAQRHPLGMDQYLLDLAIKYFHSIGRLVLLKGDLICTNPQIIPKLTAQFIAPVEIRARYSTLYRHIPISKQEHIDVLAIPDNNSSLRDEVQVLEAIGLCFKLDIEDWKGYLFPSIADKTTTFSLDSGPLYQLHAIRFTAPHGTSFVPGFFCQLIVSLFEYLNVS